MSGERSLMRKLKDWKVAQPLTSSDDSVTVARKPPSRITAALGAWAFGKCTSYLSCCCDQMPDTKQLKGEGPVCPSSKHLQWEVAGHLESTVKKARDGYWFSERLLLLPFPVSLEPRLWKAQPTPSSPEHAHKCSLRCVSQGISKTSPEESEHWPPQ